MKTSISSLAVIILAVLLMTNCAYETRKDYPIDPVPLAQVQVEDAFWSRRIETNRTVTIPHAFRKCEKLGRVDNFAIAGGLKSGTDCGRLI